MVFVYHLPKVRTSVSCLLFQSCDKYIVSLTRRYQGRFFINYWSHWARSLSHQVGLKCSASEAERCHCLIICNHSCTAKIRRLMLSVQSSTSHYSAEECEIILLIFIGQVDIFLDLSFICDCHFNHHFANIRRLLVNIGLISAQSCLPFACCYLELSLLPSPGILYSSVVLATEVDRCIGQFYFPGFMRGCVWYI